MRDPTPTGARWVFDARSALRITQALSRPAFAGRRVGTAGHDLAARWIEGRWAEWGYRSQRHSFTYPLSIADVAERPGARVWYRGRGTAQGLPYRRDFAEHPASAAAEGRIRGAIAEWAPTRPFRGRWALARTVAGAPSLREQALVTARNGGVGLIVPFRVGPGAVIFKQPLAGSPLALPTLFLRRERLIPSLPSRLEVDLELKRRPLRGANLVVERPGSDPSLAHHPLLVGAHYDAVGDDPGGPRFPGASDNASGLAVVLEVARALARTRWRPNRPVWFAAFDAEEVGALGSRALAGELAHSGIVPFVINVDLAARTESPVVVEASPNSPALLTALDAVGRRHAIPMRQGPVQSDNRPFAARGFPSVGIGSGGLGYHTPLDTADRVEPGALRRVGELLLGAIRTIAG